MSGLSARVGALAATGAVSVGLLAAGAASAQAAAPTIAKPCTSVSKVAKVSGVKVNAAKQTRSGGHLACVYENTNTGQIIVTQPTRYAHMSSSVFWTRMTKTAQNYGTKLHKISSTKAYCYENTKSGGKSVIFGASDGAHHVITVESNLSVKREVALVNAIG